eukprot:1330779-Pyramimonas_sp.AAC.1
MVYTALIRAGAEVGAWALVGRLRADMRAAGILPNSYTYTALITVLGRNGHLEEASLPSPENLKPYHPESLKP